MLNRRVEETGGHVTDDCFAIPVAYFSPDAVARTLRRAEALVERAQWLGRFRLAVYVFKAARDQPVEVATE